MMCILCLCFETAGCGRPKDKYAVPTQDEKRRMELSEVGDLFRFYQLEKKKAPERFTDFERAAQPNGMFTLGPSGMTAMKNGEIIPFYKADLPDLGPEPGKGPGDVVLAFEKKVPKEGGMVLMLNRTIKTMTADEFKSAPKASTEAGTVKK
jgi:hypothetical protein